MSRLALVLLLLVSEGRLPLVKINIHSVKFVSQKDLTRDTEPVVIPASKTNFRGEKIDNFRLFRCQKGEFIPIPFQIDERKGNRYILPDGPEGEKGDGIYNDQDELVFMAGDSGDRCKPDTPGWIEITLTDPTNNRKGWVYLNFDDSLPRSSKRYICYNPGEEKISTTKYFLQFNKEHPIFFDRLGIKREAGGTGNNMIDRMKIRFSAKLVGGFLSIKKTEEDFKTRLLAYHTGPIRVVRLTRNWQTLFWKIPTPAADIVTIFYDSSFEFPVIVDLPFDVGLFLNRTYFRVSIDMRRSAGKRLFYNSNNTSPIEINGKASKHARINRDHFSWMANAGIGSTPAGWFNRIFWSAPGNPGIDIKLYFNDDLDHPDPPESEKGEYGDLGYEIEGLETVKKGRIFIKSVMYWFHDFSMEKLNDFLNIDDHPLEITISNKL